MSGITKTSTVGKRARSSERKFRRTLRRQSAQIKKSNPRAGLKPAKSRLFRSDPS